MAHAARAGEAAQIPKRRGDQSAVLETEHPAGRISGQLEIAGVVQLTDELHDGGQAKAAERSFQLNHVFEFVGALVRNAKDPPRPGLRVTKLR